MSDVPDIDLDEIYGQRPEDVPAGSRDFAPWHLPVKQIVRDYQWGSALTSHLKKYPCANRRLNYLTLPGPDMWDVRVLSDICAKFTIELEYLGFIGTGEAEPRGNEFWFPAEAALKQADRVSDASQITPDRLEQIAVPSSQAAQLLKGSRKFDVVNLDFCDHLTGNGTVERPTNMASLKALITHQLGAAQPWLLYLTTRVTTDGLVGDIQEIWNAIKDNLARPESNFDVEISAAVGADFGDFEECVRNILSAPDERLVRLFAVGVGKFLLAVLSRQPNFPGSVEMISCYAYRVAHTEPDMLAVAFRLNTGPQTLLAEPASAPLVEAAAAAAVAKKVEVRFWDIDQAMDSDEKTREAAISGTRKLLLASNYDVDAWQTWVDRHARQGLRAR